MTEAAEINNHIVTVATEFRPRANAVPSVCECKVARCSCGWTFVAPPCRYAPLVHAVATHWRGVDADFGAGEV